jgi:DNA-binding MarR family transcriptional regulator
MKSELGTRLVREIMATADIFLRESQRLFRPLGLTAAQYNVLNILAEEDGERGLSQRELGDILVVDRSNVTGLVDRMAKSGWVRRVDDPDDRRIFRLMLTPAGRELWGKATPLYHEVVGQVTAGAGRKRMEETLALLAELQNRAPLWETPQKI